MDCLKFLLSRQKDFDTKLDIIATANHGINAFVAACYNNQNNIVDYLLKNVFSDRDSDNVDELLVNKKNNKTALHFCAQAGNAAAIDKLFEFYPKICKEHCNSCDSLGQTPFLKACYNNRLECAKKLMTKENINVADNNKRTPFEYAIRNGHDRITNFLCNDVKITAEHCQLSVKNGHTTILCQLLLAQMDRNNTQDIEGLLNNEILNEKMVNEWLDICHKQGNSGLAAFLTKLKENGLKQKNSFAYIKTLLTMNSDETRNDIGSLYDAMRKGMYCLMLSFSLFFCCWQSFPQILLF